MDAKNTCDGRRNDRSHMDYKGADDVQDAFSIVSVHDPNSNRSGNALPGICIAAPPPLDYETP